MLEPNLAKGNTVEFYDLHDYKKHEGKVQRTARPYYIVQSEGKEWIISWNASDECFDGGVLE